MANIKSVNGNTIVLDGSGIEDRSVAGPKLSADMIDSLFRGLTRTRAVTAYDMAYGTWNGFVPASSSTPYSCAGWRATHVEFTLTIANGQADFWVGAIVAAGHNFVGVDVANTSPNVRYIANNSSSTTVDVNVRSKVKLNAGTYAARIERTGSRIRMWADDSLVLDFDVPTSRGGDDGVNIRGIGFLNYGFQSGNVASVTCSETELGAANLNSSAWKAASPGEYSNQMKYLDEGCYEISNAWTDRPPLLGSTQAQNGVLLVMRLNGNYNVQVFWSYGGDRNVFFRVIHRANRTEYVGWSPVGMVANAFEYVSESLITTNGWTSYGDLDLNRVYKVSSGAACTALGLPTAVGGTLISIAPYNSHSDLGYQVWLFFNYGMKADDGMVHAWVSFGHGTLLTPWARFSMTQQNTDNPLAAAMFTDEKVAFVGDSIVAGLGGTGYDVSSTGGGEYIIYSGFDRYENVAGHCWVNSMRQHISDVYGKTNVTNRGVGGIKANFASDNWATLIDGAKVVVLSVGTNNYNDIDGLNNSIRNIAKTCANSGVKLMVMTNTPNNTENKAKYNKVKGRLTATVNDLGLQLYDMYSEFEAIMDARGLTLNDVMISDGIHPNDTGYDIMFQAAKKLFGI